METSTESVAVTRKPVMEAENVEKMCLNSLKRTRDMFLSNHGQPVPFDAESNRIKIQVKIRDEYDSVRDKTSQATKAKATVIPFGDDLSAKNSGLMDTSMPSTSGNTSIPQEDEVTHITPETIDEALKSLPKRSNASKAIQKVGEKKEDTEITLYRGGDDDSGGPIVKFRVPMKVARPEWHAPWKLMRVISGHLGWVRSIAVEPANEWFATGSGDHTVKIWDLASGKLRLTLTGHIGIVRGLVVSTVHPYLFSVGDDKMVKCWDLEQNKVIRHFHGHLSGVYAVDLHPSLTNLLVTGGRDSTVRVWDMRSRAQVHVLGGHSNTVCAVAAQAADPQVISGSMDSMIRLWDLAAGRTLTTLTNHKKSIRALALSKTEWSFISGAADNIKQWAFPQGRFLRNLSGHNTIINTLAVNQDGVAVSGGDDGSLRFWDYNSGYNFQTSQTQVQSGSLESEAGIFASTFDNTGMRFFTGEADKTIKVWREDEDATPESHPINWKPPKVVERF